MDIPFKLIFKNKFKEIPVEFFVGSASELVHVDKSTAVMIKENLTTSVYFESSVPDARFYMDGLDMLPYNAVKEDERGEVYLPPLPSHQILYDDNPNNNEYYPLIPGYYRIHVTADGQSYFSWIKVTTKQMTEDQWSIMRDDIENTIQGLAQDLVRKNSSLGLDESSALPFSYLRKYYLLKEYETRMATVLQDVHKHPRSAIAKEYEMVPRGQERDIDERTIRHLSGRPEHKNFLMVPVRNVLYDLPENRYFFQILKAFLGEIQQFLDYLMSYSEFVRKERRQLVRFQGASHVTVVAKDKVLMDLEQYGQDMKRMRGMFQWCLGQSWMKEVSTKWHGTVPHATLLDPRYRLFHEVYRKLKKDTFHISIDPAFTYHWKRTEVLYEIWGFFEFIKILKEMGYVPTEGWIYDQEPEPDGFRVPELEQGTTIVFKKDQLTLRMVYDKFLPFGQKQTDLYEPLYTGGYHSRPDMRLDVYDGEGYIGSLITDFKYRPVNSIWNPRAGRQNKVMKQLDNYQSSFRSTWFLKGRMPVQILDSMLPVSEVWAAYPKNDDSPVDEGSLQYRIRLMPLTPGQDHKDLIDSLSNVIQKLLERASVSWPSR
ncbi:DUF2357 domain-containing protein [Peribacillus frigoritolerans]|uniref:DUF2357 domain-containing protein n=1 Tax=Peribacillus frigoritolerans TaxID=450367 RepID=UPI003F8040F6